MQASQDEPAQSTLNVSASIGFNRDSKDCMVIHPSDMHFIWSQGRLIVIKSIGKEKNTYLKGHDGRVTVIKCSRNGNLLASGECIGPGFQVAIIVWDFNTQEMLYRVRYHKEAILALSFSHDEKYLLSLGCKNDGN